MNSEIILSFTSNIMLLMSLAVVYSIFPYESRIRDVYKKVLMGISSCYYRNLNNVYTIRIDGWYLL